MTGLQPLAFHAALDAGGQALRISSLDEARAYFEHALAVASNNGERAEALSRLGRAHAMLGDFDAAEVSLREALQRADGFPAAMARARFEMGTTRWLRGDMKTARPFLEQAQADFRKLGQVRDRSAALGNLAVVLMLMGEYQRAVDAFKECITLDESLNDLSSVVIDCSNLGEIHVDLGALDEAEALCQRALSLAALIDAPPLTIDGQRNLARIAAQRGELDQALALAQAALELAEHYQRADLRRQSLATPAEVRLARGEVAAAEALACELRDQARDAATDRAQAGLLLGRCQLASGDGTGALLTLEQGLLDAQATFYTLLILRYHAALGQVVDHPAIAQVHRRIAAELAAQVADGLTDKHLQEQFRASPLYRSIVA
jgi:ATP/maltotriose-dependent transcriptional regulator MalT